MKVSISSIGTFKACRRKYQLRYIEGLEPIKKSEALQCGTNYHELIEALYNNGSIEVDNDNLTKELAMAMAYEKYIYPKLKAKAVEEWNEYKWSNNILVSRFDGVAEDGNLIEHKTTGSTNLDEYEYNLQWNEQILAYMLISGKRKIYYTICRKPNIRLKKDESEEDFFKRMCEWFDTDTEDKIRLVEITRTDAEVEAFRQELEIITKQIQDCHTNNELCYRNTCHCNSWNSRCEYSSVCLFYNPNEQYAEFVKNERRNADGN